MILVRYGCLELSPHHLHTKDDVVDLQPLIGEDGQIIQLRLPLSVGELFTKAISKQADAVQFGHNVPAGFVADFMAQWEGRVFIEHHPTLTYASFSELGKLTRQKHNEPTLADLVEEARRGNTERIRSFSQRHSLDHQTLGDLIHMMRTAPDLPDDLREQAEKEITLAMSAY